jgi:putative glutamine amidotransferase
MEHRYSVPEHQPFFLAHQLWFEPNTLLERLMRERLSDADACEVNSRHHQAIKRVADGFVVCGTAPDGIIEAIEDPSSDFCLGVQWHPENFWRTGEFRPIFEGFLEAAQKLIV